jgi:hypothetical protein
VLGSSRAIASLVANYEQRIAPKRKLLYSWIKKIWEVSARMWEEMDPAIAEVIAQEYRLEITPPELTPRDTLELAQTALNLVQGRLWSAERAMDRVGVEDPEGEKDLIRDEQTDATLNPNAVMTMGNLMALFQQLQQQGVQMQQMQAQQQQAATQLQAQQESAMNAYRQQGSPGGMPMMNGGEMGQVPPEMLPGNAQAPGSAMPNADQAIPPELAAQLGGQ